MTITLTHPEWNQETSGLQVAKAFGDQIRGKNVLITGVSPESIGSSTAVAVASQNPSLLVLASRTQSKLDEVVKQIRDAYSDVKVKTVLLDLMSQEAVKKAAADVAKLTDSLDIIINNAGIMSPKKLWTAEGIEGQFGSNHIGHFLFTNLLMSQLLNAAKTNPPGATRVVNLTSLGHRLSPVRFHDYNFDGSPIPDEEKHPENLPPLFLKTLEGEGTYNGYIAYGQAKSANILYSIGLNSRLNKEGIVSYSVHPGSIWTGLSRDLDADGEAAIRNTSPFWKNQDQGSATTLVAALDPALNKPQGILLHDCQVIEAAPHATDPKIADRLWALSEKLVKREFKL
ncbi:short chain dehydrogenase/ reductase-like protein [Lojkania enalia]|uniref:Short chain dehydrogenase/ reductase-like protein n=1 Tax=Lojkania enalia TaxID=147567 RepID=A0A9P4NB29_9PLEO|nr:short chain dehydrogenase/ reductase-like protein [Didymosphaeria enalia]